MLNHAVMNKKRYQMQFFPEKRLEKRERIHPTHYSRWVVLQNSAIYSSILQDLKIFIIEQRKNC